MTLSGLCKRAIDTVSDPEIVDMNLLVVPGLTKPSFDRSNDQYL